MKIVRVQTLMRDAREIEAELAHPAGSDLQYMGELTVG